MIIEIRGAAGEGKTSIAVSLREFLRAKGFDVKLTDADVDDSDPLRTIIGAQNSLSVLASRTKIEIVTQQVARDESVRQRQRVRIMLMTDDSGDSVTEYITGTLVNTELLAVQLTPPHLREERFTLQNVVRRKKVEFVTVVTETRPVHAYRTLTRDRAECGTECHEDGGSVYAPNPSEDGRVTCSVCKTTPAPPIDTCVACVQQYWACQCGASPIPGFKDRPPMHCKNKYCKSHRFRWVETRRCCQNFRHHLGTTCLHCGQKG